MTIMSLRETLLHEIDNLPETRQGDVLAFVRFLKIGLANPQTLDRQFSEALSRARAIARERGITQQEIEEEISAVRAGQ